LGAFWGYNPRNYTPKILQTPEHYIETLVQIAAMGGNYLLNVGPDPTGKFHPMAVDYLTKIGAWVKVNGAAVYGVTGNPFPSKPTWGYVTSREGKVYLIVKDWPAGGELTMPLLKNKIKGARLLKNPGRPIPVVAGAQDYTIGPVAHDPTQPFTVVELLVKGIPQAQLESTPAGASSLQ
jgi:alpha-L-fucosidase